MNKICNKYKCIKRKEDNICHMNCTKIINISGAFKTVLYFFFDSTLFPLNLNSVWEFIYVHKVGVPLSIWKISGTQSFFLSSIIINFFTGYHLCFYIADLEIKSSKKKKLKIWSCSSEFSFKDFKKNEVYRKIFCEDLHKIYFKDLLMKIFGRK